ncbi:MAG: hypothetical protein OTI36_13430, partial [Beijerinckiaceae bacterium]|nr:hypothetical protein [Beijerinckiaceae bacterium]
VAGARAGIGRIRGAGRVGLRGTRIERGVRLRYGSRLHRFRHGFGGLGLFRYLRCTPYRRLHHLCHRRYYY